MKLSEAPTVHPTATVTDSTLGRWTEVGARTRILESTMGDYSYIVDDGQITYADIGKFGNFASNVRFNPTNHPTWRVTAHHFTYRCADYFEDAEHDERIFQWRRSHRVTVGHDVWVGHGATVMPGVSLGHGAVVGAGAVVTKDVAPYQVVAGVPARVISERFPAAIAERIMSLGWWDWDHAALREALPDFQDMPPDAFLEKYGG